MYKLEDVSNVANFITAYEYEESRYTQGSHFLIFHMLFVSKGSLFGVYLYVIYMLPVMIQG